jgi:hypothetical protein
MTEPNVQAQAAALRALSTAITRYAEQLREAIRNAHRDADTLVKRTEDAVSERKSEWDRAERQAKRAEDAATACRDPRQAAGLRAEAAARRGFADKRLQFYGHAQQAAKAAAEARTRLFKVMSALDASVGADSSVATTVLGKISGKLDEIGMPDRGTRIMRGVRDIAVTAAVVADGVIGASHAAQALQTIRTGGEYDGHPETSQQVQAEQRTRLVEYAAESIQSETERRNRHLGERPPS